MSSFAATLAAIAAAVWIGAVVFQSFFVAPAAFRSLDADDVKRFLRTIFPRFFRLGVICGLVMVVGLVTASSGGGPVRESWMLVAAAGVAAMAAISLALVPSINRARDAGEAGARRFKALHGSSVILTLISLGLGIAVLAALAADGAGR
jgi:uncharacterized membrane protein